ncbi:MAG: NTP transferase domain-containing protein [Tannerellaceae bacterium]|jgi:NDP-sugar pyrophosphorylase family protein|nr:NTP transferase domain-containing protein [Tannerellaceae bacterium]
MDFAILAAGRGERLAQDGVACHKAMVRIGGVPLIERMLGILVNSGASRISVIVNEDMTEVREYIEGLNLNAPLFVVTKSTPGPAHSLFNLRNYLTGREFCALTVDSVFLESEFKAFVHDFKASKADGLLGVTKYLNDEKPLYVNVDYNMTVNSFTDTPDVDRWYVSGGIYLLKRMAIDILVRAVLRDDVRMRDFQRLMLSEGMNLKAWPFGKIVDVDHASDIADAEGFLRSVNE